MKFGPERSTLANTALVLLFSLGLVLTPAWGQEALPTPTVSERVAEEATSVPKAAPSADSKMLEQAEKKPVKRVGDVIFPKDEEKSQTLNMPSEAEKAQAAEDWKSAGEVGESTFFDKLASVTWSLALVCLLIWAISKVVGRSTMQKLGLPVAGPSQIDILEKKRLSPGRSIMLVKVGPKVLAVAATENGYQTLTEMETAAYEECVEESEAKAVEALKPDNVDEVEHVQQNIVRHYLSIIPGVGQKK